MNSADEQILKSVSTGKIILDLTPGRRNIEKQAREQGYTFGAAWPEIKKLWSALQICRASGVIQPGKEYIITVKRFITGAAECLYRIED